MISNQLASLLRLGDLLRRHHPQGTLEAVVARIDVSKGTVQKWLSRECGPNSGHLAMLADIYGPEVFATLYETPPSWLASAVEAEKHRRPIGEGKNSSKLKR